MTAVLTGSEKQRRTHHYISTKAVRSLILEAIRYVSQFALADEAAFLQKMRETSEIQQEEAAKALNGAVDKVRVFCCPKSMVQ